jgi:hypothetical protein
MNKIGFCCLVLLCIFNNNVIGQTMNASDKSFGQLVYSKIDYNRLSDDVKQQINKNKLADKSLFDGVSRAFVVDVYTINSKDDIDNRLSFLFTSSNLKDVKYIAGNQIQIIASIETEATLFKELFLSNNVNANFIDQKFVVYQVK